MRTLRTTGSGNEQTLNSIEGIKVPVYDTTADAEADLANLAEGQIVATKDAGGDEQTLFEYVDAKLQTTEVDVPITGVFLTCKARKSGNTVTIELSPSGNDLIVPYAANQTIGTLPEGYRPDTVKDFEITGRIVSPNSAVYPPRCIINTNGEMNIRAWNSTQDVVINSAYNVFTFLVDGTNSHYMSVNSLKEAKDYTDEKIYNKIAATSIVSDCNKTIVPGTYTVDGGTLNTPNQMYGILVVFGQRPDKASSAVQWVIQKLVNLSTEEVYTRECINPNTTTPSASQWTAWTLGSKQLSKYVCDPSGSAVLFNPNSVDCITDTRYSDGRHHVSGLMCFWSDGVDSPGFFLSSMPKMDLSIGNHFWVHISLASGNTCLALVTIGTNPTLGKTTGLVKVWGGPVPSTSITAMVDFWYEEA